MGQANGVYETVDDAMTRIRLHLRVLSVAFVAVLLAGVLVSVTPPIPAQAIDHSQGYGGYCKDDVGVTVVIDFQALGGTVIVRCNPTSTAGTGLDALKGAGIQIAGVQRWGESFICRIENRPSASEVIPITGRSGYREKCIDTPPATAYWSYWHSGNNCSWQYSQWGVKNRNFVKGGFEGWSFSLNATADTNPAPRIAPVRPGTAGQSCVETEEAKPTSTSIYESAPAQTNGGSVSTRTATSTGPTSAASLPAPRSRAATPSGTSHEQAGNSPVASTTVPYTGGDDQPDVNRELSDQNAANAWAPWVAGGVLVVLAGTIGFTAVRRRQRR